MAMSRLIYKGGVPFIKPGIVFKGESGICTNPGAPTSGTSGTGANRFGSGSLLIDTTNINLYMNLGTLASPTWTLIGGTLGSFYGFSASQPVALSVNGAITPHGPSANYAITKAGVLADTLAAPTAGTDDGAVLLFTSNTANAHTITATGLLQTGSAFVNVATFNAQPGASLALMAYQAKWNVLFANGISFS